MEADHHCMHAPSLNPAQAIDSDEINHPDQRNKTLSPRAKNVVQVIKLPRWLNDWG